MHLAVDLGAESGRVMLGALGPSGVRLHEIHRFAYGPRRHDGHLRWNFTALVDGMREGVRRAGREAAALDRQLESIGVDAWGVDYGLIDADGGLLEEPVCYRDARTANIVDTVAAVVARDEIFRRTGIQILPLNTLYQLAAHVVEGLPPNAARLLLIPDLCHHALCGSRATERTNASTTQLLRVEDGKWDEHLFASLRLPLDIMPEVVPPGTELGTLSSVHQRELGVGALRVIAPATHDTASAVVGTPLRPGWAYVSSGTWSLVGIEREAPLVTEDAARANFTNEAGAGGTTRFLKNVAGLWLLQACRREWDADTIGIDYDALVARVEAIPRCAGVVFPDNPRFFNPPSMTEALRGSLAESGQPVPSDPLVLAKVILDSLALRYASVVSTIETLTGQRIEGLHVVGGGALNRYLNQATADATGRPVLAGPAQAAAYGNALVQAIACGHMSSIAEGRSLLAAHVRPQLFTPSRRQAWAEAIARYHEIEAASAV